MEDKDFTLTDELLGNDFSASFTEREGRPEAFRISILYPVEWARFVAACEREHATEATFTPYEIIKTEITEYANA